MKLMPEQLNATSPSAMASAYLLSGDEPLLLDEALDAIRSAARERGLERDSLNGDRAFDWGMVTATLASPSLFSPGRLVEIRLASTTPGEAGSRSLRELATRAPDGNVVVVVVPALNRKTAQAAWVQAFQQSGVWVELRAPDLADLPRWIQRRMAAASLSCDPEALELLAARVEGNLLAARQEVGKLALLYPPGTTLTATEVRTAVADGARYDVFQLADAALDGQVARAARILDGLREEGVAPSLVLWSLVRETLPLVDAGARAAGGVPLPKAIAAAGVWQSRAGLYGRALRGRRPGSLRRLTGMAGLADQIVKGIRPGEPWNALLELTLALAGHDEATAELA